MTDPKPIASLSPALLARKGSAKPAMRHQLRAGSAALRQFDHDDLGFNDLGEDLDEHPGAEVVALNPGNAANRNASVPEVVRQRQDAASRISQPAKPRRSALAQGRNAAFTLRLDSDRHLKLRLASTLEGRSAQQLLSEALDSMIAQMPDVLALASEARKRRKNS